jgi:ABC-type sugar transport system substrate-binding protein
MTRENDYQLAQLTELQSIAHSLDLDIEVFDAGNDAIAQTQHLLQVIMRPQNRPLGILCNAVGSGMPQVARAAAAAGIGWAILNREVDYLETLWNRHHVPACSVRPDQTAVGRIQGSQMNALLPGGGSVLCVTGPTSSSVTAKRMTGMQSVLNSNFELHSIHGQWTQESAYRAVGIWLQLTTSREKATRLVVCHNDDMAQGARQAFLNDGPQWKHLRFLGIDGLPAGGQSLVRQKILLATVVLPHTAGTALKLLEESRRTGKQPPAETLLDPVSYPAVSTLTAIPS